MSTATPVTPPRFSLLGLPLELRAHIVRLAALQDEAYRQRIDSFAHDTQRRALLVSKEYGRSIQAVSLVSKELARLEFGTHLQGVRASATNASIFRFSIISRYAPFFSVIDLDASALVPDVEFTLAMAPMFRNANEIKLHSLPAHQAFGSSVPNSRLARAAFRNAVIDIHTLSLVGLHALSEELAVWAIESFRSLNKLVVHGDPFMHAGRRFGQAPHLAKSLSSFVLDLSVRLTNLTLRTVSLGKDEWGFLNAFAATLEHLAIHTETFDDHPTTPALDGPVFPRLEELVVEVSSNEDATDYAVRLVSRFWSSPLRRLDYTCPCLAPVLHQKHPLFRLIEAKLPLLRHLSLSGGLVHPRLYASEAVVLDAFAAARDLDTTGTLVYSPFFDPNRPPVPEKTAMAHEVEAMERTLDFARDRLERIRLDEDEKAIAELLENLGVLEGWRLRWLD